MSHGSFTMPQVKVRSATSPVRRLAADCFAPLRRCLVVVMLVLSVGTIASVANVAGAEDATPAVGVGPADASSSLIAAAKWLLGQQAESGGFLGYTGDVDASSTSAAILALYAAGEGNGEVAGSIEKAMVFLDRFGGDYAAAGPGQAANLVMAVIAGGKNPRAFAGRDLVAALMAPPATPVPSGVAGIYGDDLYDHGLVLLALVAAGEPVPDAALEPVRAAQAENGGWAYDGATDPSAADSNTTSLIIQALVASGHGKDPMVTRGLAFLHTLQTPNGSGFAYGVGDPLQADANSTALVVQAVIAAGEDPSSQEWGNAMEALWLFQSDGGGFRYLAGDTEPNLFATVQVMPAVAGLPLPVAKVCMAEEASEGARCVELAPAA